MDRVAEDLRTQGERRRSARARCRIPVKIALGKQKLRGLVRNMSGEGLCIVLDEAIDPQQGETLRFVVAKAGAPKEPISALVWHADCFRNPSNGNHATRLGLVLSNPSPLFDALLKRFAPKPSATPAPRRGAPPIEGAAEAEQLARETTHFDVQVRGAQGPHIYTFAVKAASEAEARAKFSGGIWQVVAVLNAA